MSTGMFPQEFIIRFPDYMKISVISVHSFNGRSRGESQHVHTEGLRSYTCVQEASAHAEKCWKVKTGL